jgi:phosphatidylserine/phosphatidylglycerophosphate/cardiolipin synthase-like enzyme
MILVTGGAWTHLGHRTVDAVMEELLAQARRDVVMTVYLATATREFAKHVTGLLERGVEVRLIFNDWTGLSPTLRGGLSELALRFEGLRLFQFVDPEGRGVLHAKAVSVDSIKAIVGSANLSRAGMLWNYEMGVLLEGPDAEEVSRLLYGLISSDKIREV